MKLYKIVLIFISSLMLLQCHGKDNQISDSERFALEYPLVGGDNIFVYRNADETADILAKGRGIVFIGFKECPWCQLYAVFLHDVALEMEIDKIYYCDIKEDRESNSESYRRIAGILDGRLQYDDEGRPRVYVPDVSIVSRGRIIARDFETSKETLGYDTPQEYWNDERVNALKERLRAGIEILKKIIANSCNVC
jgi:predicted bacteriocin transport accessory protein